MCAAAARDLRPQTGTAQLVLHPARLPLAGYPQVWHRSGRVPCTAMSGSGVSPGTERVTLCEFLDYQREALIGRLSIMGSFDLDAPCARSDKVNENLRWVAVHMIEETARHAGHADIIRETIDGTRGR